jgi:hypothetical protein
MKYKYAAVAVIASALVAAPIASAHAEDWHHRNHGGYGHDNRGGYGHGSWHHDRGGVALGLGLFTAGAALAYAATPHPVYAAPAPVYYQPVYQRPVVVYSYPQPYPYPAYVYETQ